MGNKHCNRRESMLGTRERNDVNVRQERANEYAPLNSNDFRTDYSFRGYDSRSYNSDSNVRYAQRYENIDFYDSQYDCQATENVFRPIELSDISADIKPQKKVKQKSKINIGTKGKILIAVYTALVVMVIAMLLINAIPAVNAQTFVTDPIAKEIVTEPGVNQPIDDILVENGVTKGDGYVYDNDSSWFERFCDAISKIFG